MLRLENRYPTQIQMDPALIFCLLVVARFGIVILPADSASVPCAVMFDAARISMLGSTGVPRTERKAQQVPKTKVK